MRVLHQVKQGKPVYIVVDNGIQSLPERKGLAVSALPAVAVFLFHTGDRRKVSLDCAEDFADPVVFRVPRQTIAAGRAADAC